MGVGKRFVRPWELAVPRAGNVAFVRNGGLPSRRFEPQPALERGVHFVNDTSIELSWGSAHKLGELDWLNALDVDVALLPQPRHARQRDLVRCILKLPGDQNHTRHCQSGIGLSRQHERVARFPNQAQVNEPNFSALRYSSHP